MLKIVAVVALLAMALSATPSVAVDTPTMGPSALVAPIMEDSPMWDCETMGNRVCGPITVVLDTDLVTIGDALGTYATVGVDTLAFTPTPIGTYLGAMPVCEGRPHNLGVTVLGAPTTALGAHAAIVGNDASCLLFIGTVTTG